MSTRCEKDITIVVKDATPPPPFAYFKLDEATLPITILANSMGSGDLRFNASPNGARSVPGKLNGDVVWINGWAQPTFGLIGQPLASWVLDNDFTIRFWWNPTDIPGSSKSLFFGYSPYHWQVLLNASGSFPNFTVQIEFDVDTNGGSIVLLGPEITPAGLNQWYHVMITVESGVGASMRINDSIEVTELDATGTESYATGGMYYTAEMAATVLVDEIAIWKQKLTQAQITYDYNGGSGRSYP